MLYVIRYDIVLRLGVVGDFRFVRPNLSVWAWIARMMFVSARINWYRREPCMLKRNTEMYSVVASLLLVPARLLCPELPVSFGAGAPKQRTQQQMERLASHMRYCKLRKTAAKLGVLLAEKQSKESLGKRYKLSAKDMCTIAFSCSHRRTMLADRF